MPSPQLPAHWVARETQKCQREVTERLRRRDVAHAAVPQLALIGHTDTVGTRKLHTERATRLGINRQPSCSEATALTTAPPQCRPLREPLHATTLKLSLLIAPTGPHGDTLQATQGLCGQVRVLMGLLDTAWQWKGRRGRLLWESMHWTSRCLNPAVAAQPSGH